jgi:hypothetical protein
MRNITVISRREKVDGALIRNSGQDWMGELVLEEIRKETENAQRII